MELIWSSKLEELARRFHENVATTRGGDPFSRVCAVTGSRSRGEWLREWRLFDAPDPGRPVLAGIDAVTLHPFVGDWLYAAAERRDPKMRRPSAHPYSRDVLQWRLDRLLRDVPEDFAPLRAYLAGSADSAPMRRFALAGKLAETFDDYQSHRPEMLLRWERGEGAGRDAWQADLWRRLRAQGDAGDSLSAQFRAVARGEIDLAAAFEHGVPRYSSVHVFGVSTMPRPYIAFFEALSRVVPVFVYAFNPCGCSWFDDERWSRARHHVVEEARTAALRAVDRALDSGEQPDIAEYRRRLAEASHPLLGSLAVGCQALLGELLDSQDGRFEDCGEAPAGDSLLARLQRQLYLRDESDERDRPVAAGGDPSFCVHVVSTPHREAEIIRDGLLQWFSDHPGARARDAIVLCADFAKIAPHLQAVFAGAADSPSIPFSMPGGAGGDPFGQAFLSLVELSGSRFEADAVLQALAVPSTAARFGIGPGDFETLRTLVQAANIRWGLDDAHVDECASGGDASGAVKHRPFTWRRGLDRMLLGALCGPLEKAPGGIMDAGTLGRMRPAGDAESDRASLAGRLSAFIDALAWMRSLRKAEGSPDFWSERFMSVIDRFFEISDDNHRAVSAVRSAVATVAARMREADAASGEESPPRPFSVFAAALEQTVNAAEPPAAPVPDAVLVAPLRAGVPVPRRLVWVCGLSGESVFPRQVRRPAFDLIGAHPAPLDPSPRDDDALALLEAICAARETFVTSRVGVNPRDGSDIPAVPLEAALEDYLGARFARAGDESAPPYRIYRHSLHGFSPVAFSDKPPRGGDTPPPPASRGDYEAACQFAGGEAASAAAVPFAPKIPDDISIDSLAEIFGSPGRFVLRTFARVSNPGFGRIETQDAMTGDIPKDMKLRFSRLCDFPEQEARLVGEELTELGHFPDPELGARGARNEWASEAREDFRKRVIHQKHAGSGVSVPLPAPGHDGALDMLDAADAAKPLQVRFDVEAAGRKFRISGAVRAVPLPTSSGEVEFAPALEDDLKSAWSNARAWVRHLAACAGGAESVAVRLSGIGNNASKDVLRLFPVVPRDEAKSRIAELLEIVCTPFPGGLVFDPKATMQVAEAGQDVSLEQIRMMLRSFGNAAKLEDRVLGADHEAKLDDAAIETFKRFSLAFWKDFPYLAKKKGGKGKGGRA